MKLGTKVRKVVPDIEGTVTSARWDERDATLLVCVRCIIDGVEHDKWYRADDLEVIYTPTE